MATFNWTLAAQRSKQAIREDFSDKNRYDAKKVIESWRNKKWPFGKNRGKKLRDLSLDYLGWVIDNFEEDHQGYKLAKQELECRYETAHKVGGPDNNTAV